MKFSRKWIGCLLSSGGLVFGIPELPLGPWVWPGVQAAHSYFDAEIISASFEAPREGEAKAIAGTLKIQNISRQPVAVEVVTGSNRAQNITLDRRFRQPLVINPGAALEVPVTISLSEVGPQVVYLPVNITQGGLRRGQILVGNTSLVVEADGRYRRLRFTEAFGRESSLLAFPGGRIEPNPFEPFDPDKAASLPRRVTLPRQLDVGGRIMDRSPELPLTPRRPDIRVPTDSLPTPVRPPTIQGPDSLAPSSPIVSAPLDLMKRLNLSPAFVQSQQTLAQARPSLTVQGRILFESSNGLTYPATNWWVRILDGNQELASQYIAADGGFSLTVPATIRNPRILVSAHNRWFKVTNPDNGDPYRYRIPEEDLQLLARIAGTANVGSWKIPNPLVGDVYQEGQRLWSRLFYVAGLNPLRDQVVDVSFPETRARCNGRVWSCASLDGWISLLEIHAAPGTMAHELAHQADFAWNGRTPRMGGQHSFGVCYDATRDGMILTEGFANFLPTWALSDTAGRRSGQNYHNFRGLAGPVGNLDLETSPPEPRCGDNTAELQFSAALWDGHDLDNDGQDGVFYVHPAAQILLYAAGNQGNVAAYLTRLQSLTTPDWGKAAIERAYNQNGISQ
jgi:hypothetical protein